MTDKILGQLEIDHLRGVVYFHASGRRTIARFGAQTILRICQLPVIPEDTAIDISHMHGVSFNTKVYKSGQDSAPTIRDMYYPEEQENRCYTCGSDLRNGECPRECNEFGPKLDINLQPMDGDQRSRWIRGLH